MFLRNESNINVIKYKIEGFEEVDDVSIQMQQLNKIKGLLTFGRTNNTLLFAVSGLIPLKEFVEKSEQSQAELVENFKNQYLEILESVKNYMIPKEELILNFEFSYVDDEGNLFLPCVPTDWSHLESRTMEEFSAMIISKTQERSTKETPVKKKKPQKEKVKKEHKLLKKLKESFNGGEDDDIFSFQEDETLLEGISVIAVRKTGEEYPLLFGPDIIGTDEQKCSICFAGNENMSAEHAGITLSKGKYFIADLNSKSGTLLNGQQLEPGKAYELSSADLITIAGEELVFSKRN